MAHFAQVDAAGVVLRVVVIDDAHEESGPSFITDVMGISGTWIQTSYSGSMRKTFAGVGFTYDSVRDAFIPPPPYSSWVLDEETCRWLPPVPAPDDGLNYLWDEAGLTWSLS
jgi:hypothetical protein